MASISCAGPSSDAGRPYFSNAQKLPKRELMEK
jgi:hypothetical protein